MRKTLYFMLLSLVLLSSCVNITYTLFSVEQVGDDKFYVVYYVNNCKRQELVDGYSLQRLIKISKEDERVSISGTP